MSSINKEKIKKWIVNVVIILGVMFTFLILDVGIRCFLWKDVGFVSYRSFSPLAFSVSYVLILLMFIFLFPKKFKVMYITGAVIFNIYTFAQMLHFKILSNFFSVVSLFLAGEGAEYLSYIFSSIDIKMLALVLVSILSVVVVLFLEKKFLLFEEYKATKKKNVLVIVFTLILIVGLRNRAMFKLGDAVSNKAWDSWKVPRNIYDNFNDKNKSLMVSGMYEYIVRDAYLYVKRLVNPDAKKDIEVIDKYISSSDLEYETNKYTGIFKDKNLIMIMMESIDESLVNKEVMPTLTKLAKNGFNFKNRYAPFFGGAMTINSEFASISGLYSIVYDKAIYNYNENDFKYSLPSLFKENGYTVNSIHMNDGNFYNRNNFHASLGFDKHYALYQQSFEGNFVFDSQIASNDDSYDLIKFSDKFMTFITTYSAHVPYTNSDMCKKLIDDNKDLVVDDEELTCLRLLANETDNFIKVLIDRLEEDDLLDDTVLVLFSDHYSYGYSGITEYR